MSIRNKTTIIVIAVLAATSVYMFRRMGIADEKVAQDKADLTQQVQLQGKANGDIRAPLDRPFDRITKKPFGIEVSPQNSPVQPERFTGFHTGVDLEVFADEMSRDIPVRALCSGPLKQKQTASGYGGLVIQQCSIQNQTVMVFYGHLNLASVKAGVGNTLTAGDVIGVLGADKSKDSGGERKHLHLGIHKGAGQDIRGYVQNKSELQNWIDPKPLLAGL